MILRSFFIFIIFLRIGENMRKQLQAKQKLACRHDILPESIRAEKKNRHEDLGMDNGKETEHSQQA